MEEEFQKNAQNEQPESTPFVPSSPGKRVFAWVLFAVVVLGIATWLLNMARPDWISSVKDCLSNLL